jgi:FkbH-like protein
MEPIPSIQEHYLTDNDLFRKALWETAISMYRTIHRVDTVKLVVLDLDDTLWEGLAGEQEEVGPHMFENWFLGIAEALHYLRKRGILLAIVSKNDEQWVRSLWKKIVVGRLWLDEFAVVKINWNPKPDNMREILEQLNLLPRNVLFIDDNPAEREAMQTAFPEMRVLGRYTYYLRRILLWSAETQVAEITEESGNRTNIVRSQIERDKLRPKMSRQEFLAALKLRIKMNEIQDTGHPRFARALELLNKTNQFNSNGRRWKHEECAALFAADGRFLIFSARDRFSDYGTVGVVVIRADVIEQFVMSCRVVGLELEIGAVLLALEKLRQFGIFEVTASIEETSANFVCRDLYQRCGFTASGSHWVSATSGTKPWPGHLETEP